MGRTRAKHQVTDFSYLLDEFHTERGSDESVVPFGCNKNSADVLAEESSDNIMNCITDVVSSFIYQESEYRHKCLSDESVLFAIIRSEGRIHDKTCCALKTCGDDDIEFTSEYDSSMCQCLECKTKAAIRVGAKDNDIEAHERFFKRVSALPDFIYRMYITMGLKTTVANNVLTVWYKEDVWKIIAHDKSCIVELKHNNYVPLKDKERKFIEGFHVQNGYINFKNAINYIHSYEYIDHSKVPEPKTKPVENIVPYDEKFREKSTQGIIGRIFAKPVFWYLKKFVFHNIDSNPPLPNKRCLIIYKGKDGGERIRAGAYQPDRRCFSVSYCGKTDKISIKKVKYWIVQDELDEVLGGIKVNANGK